MHIKRALYFCRSKLIRYKPPCFDMLHCCCCCSAASLLVLVLLSTPLCACTVMVSQVVVIDRDFESFVDFVFAPRLLPAVLLCCSITGGVEYSLGSATRWGRDTSTRAMIPFQVGP